jgi:glyoxylase-like metal-dependent hydrolase (beta-lactamase superfamily II)
MNTEAQRVCDGIILFEGKTSRHLMVDPMVSNTYLLDDGKQVVIFDPSCGKKIAKSIEAYISLRVAAGGKWETGCVIAGHSHIDHANNFYVSDLFGSAETHVLVHERGFEGGKVMNDPVPFVQSLVEQTAEHYSMYRLFFFPYNILMYPLVALNAVSPSLASTVFSRIGAAPFPRPVDGSTSPEPLRESDLQTVKLEGLEIKCWKLGDKLILPTPGHSPCSVSLLWPNRKALFVSDADWIGNPTFPTSSVKQGISSLQTLKALSEAGQVNWLLPAHGIVKRGLQEILIHLNYRIMRLQALREEVLSFYQVFPEKNDLLGLTNYLVQRSPLFRTLKNNQYPRFVLFVHNIVLACLREEGLLS